MLRADLRCDFLEGSTDLTLRLVALPLAARDGPPSLTGLNAPLLVRVGADLAACEHIPRREFQSYSNEF